MLDESWVIVEESSWIGQKWSKFKDEENFEISKELEKEEILKEIQTSSGNDWDGGVWKKYN